MKDLLTKLAGITALSLLLSLPARAVVIDLGIWDPPKGGESATKELAFLNSDVIPAYNATHDDLLAATFGTDNIDTPSGPLSITVDVSGYDYIKLKWDGMWQFYYVAGEGELTFDSTVFNSGEGHEPQALSHYTLFSPHGVPDGGTTAALLGLGLVAASLIARRQNLG